MQTDDFRDLVSSDETSSFLSATEVINKAEKICSNPNCKKRYINKDKKNKFCSFKCYREIPVSEETKLKMSQFRKGKRNGVPVVPRLKICVGCGKKFQIKKKPKKKYCSRKCYFTNQTIELREKRSFLCKNRVFSLETRKKMSDSGKKKIFSEEHRKKLSESAKRKIVSAETCKKISEKVKKYIKKYGNPMLGKHHSEETKNKLREKRKNYTHSEQTKKKISESNKGKIFSEETRRKLSESNIRTKKERPYNHTEESKKKISITSTGRLKSEEVKKRISESNKKTKGLQWQDEEFIERMLLKSPKFCNTKPEKKLNEILLQLNLSFKHLKRINNIAHPVVADFFLLDYNCVVEVDGVYWHHYPHGNEIDHIRNEEMLQAGYKVIRIWETEVEKEIVISKFKEVGILI